MKAKDNQADRGDQPLSEKHHMQAMNTVARALRMSCSADIGLISLSYTCFSNNHAYSEVLSLPKSGVNTDKLDALERFVRHFDKEYATQTVRDIHHRLDQIQKMSGNYDPLRAGLAAALECGGCLFGLFYRFSRIGNGTGHCSAA